MFFASEELIALIVSIAIESLFVAICAQVRKKDWRKLAIIAGAATSITHPIAWKLFIELSPYLSFPMRSLLIETGVALVEGLMYRWAIGYSWRWNIGLSFGANLASYSCGLLFYYWQG